MPWKYDSVNTRDAHNIYRNENDFMCNRVDYERDEDNGRCYQLCESCNLRPEWDGALVRRRISAKAFEERKAACLEAIEKYEARYNKTFGNTETE